MIDWEAAVIAFHQTLIDEKSTSETLGAVFDAALGDEPLYKLDMEKADSKRGITPKYREAWESMRLLRDSGVLVQVWPEDST